MQNGKLIISFIFIFQRQIAFSQAAEDNVYKIIISTTPNTEILETGFKLKGRNKGIITCLHGIVEGKFFTALGEKKVFKGLTVTSVDIDHDLAYLQSDQLSSDADGLDVAAIVPLSEKKLKVLGYPDGMSEVNEKSVSVGHPNLKLLGQILPAKLEKLFKDRKSPSLNSNVIYVEGQMIPGDSGAPLLDEHNLVYGVIIGGVDRGSAGITWAIPVKDIKWTDASTVSQAINNLNSKDANSLFAFKDTDEPDSANPSLTVKPLDMNGVWELTQIDCRTLHPDGTLDNTHWTIKGLLSLTQKEDKTIHGKYSDRASVYFSKGDVSGTVNPEGVKFTIICTEGACVGSGISVTGKFINGTLIPKIVPLEDRPPRCILYIAQQVMLNKD